jgi:hypothetical protein
MEKLWHLHDHTEDRKIKLASLEFDGMPCVGGILLCENGEKTMRCLFFHGVT